MSAGTLHRLDRRAIPGGATERVLRVVMVSPSRYDGNNVSVFALGISPNGALGALAGLAEDYNRRHAGQARIDYEFFDEHVRFGVTALHLRQWRDAAEASGARFLVMVCGVQTVTYPRARDIALMARSEGCDVIAGGVHLSAHAPSVDFLLSCGVRVAIGEVEPLWDTLIEDALAGRLRALYRITDAQGVRVKSAVGDMVAPDITAVPFPHIPKQWQRRYINPTRLFIDSSRGCPFLCTFCVIKNVFGRTVRSRDPKSLVEWMVERVRQDGVTAFGFTDDNFVRNPRHPDVLRGLAEARAAGLRFTIWVILDVEATCYAEEAGPRGEKTREFLRLCAEAGVGHVYIGLESTDDAVLREMRKGVNRDRERIHDSSGQEDVAGARRALIERYRAAVRAWHSIGASVECGYIFGFDNDTPGVGKRAAEDLVAIGVDVASFFLLAPLPGSEDYAKAVASNTLVQTDFNEYFQRPMLRHPTLSADELQAEIDEAQRVLWSWRNVLRRSLAAVSGVGRRRTTSPLIYLKRQFSYKIMVSAGLRTYGEGGLWRRRPTPQREAITDEAARRFYLGSIPPAESVPLARPDDADMNTLPVLRGSSFRPSGVDVSEVA